ncbi:YchO/YchP family invasin [Escherichia coli]|nr:YchO/YchP family invasin [Escherichia coli]EHH6660609.1 YchO/YchP family invasin [Escherichia coli]EHH8587767.1 YchO/YchP family invasin [Escherichia coli]EHH8628221.1 YchO/YchP family invasin [Escherichia coli]EHI0321363.1 YchO/YchP family invasin [Escherichia coli]
MSRFVPRIIPFYLLLLAAGGTANAQSTFEQKAANPFDNNNDGLPDLGMAPENHDGEKHFAEIVKDFGETSMNDNGLDTGEQAKAFALGKNWLVGYNTFYDNLLDENLQRAGFGAEAWGEYLRLSANFYQPFAAWHEQTATQEQRMARGYDLTARMRMPFYQHLNTSVSVEQYFGDRVDLFNSGTGYHNPVALSLGLNYTPVPLVTVTAQHKQGESGENQNNLGLNLNYRFGVPLKKQLSAGEVAESQSLRGSRYDNPQRNNLPTLEYRQRKTLTVFLATPPWDLKPGETVPLKLQIRSRYGIRQLIWQGDTQILSLTPGAQANSAEGWTLIMPDWQNGEGASNHWRLSVVVEDNQGQRVSSNEITLTLVEPFDALSNDELRWEP